MNVRFIFNRLRVLQQYKISGEKTANSPATVGHLYFRRKQDKLPFLLRGKETTCWKGVDWFNRLAR